VFVFNHQSQVDILVMASLLRRDVGFVAKQEVRRHPIMGPAGAFIGTVFIDRSDRARAVAALRPAVDALRAGHSIAIAPEGTRSRDGALGPFKKGAFHMARAAGVPVVPVVIHDAWRAMPRGAWAVRPARVHVDVLEPVPTSGWRAETLDAHVHEVRARFLAALGQASGD
jgi:putative phosphoserine phosphatase/1-acylglycerol-3-phosphate O-acyltransferase